MIRFGSFAGAEDRTTVGTVYPEPMITLTIDLPDALEHWVASRVTQGGYIDAGEYVRDLIRRDRDTWRMTAALADQPAPSVIDDDASHLSTDA